MNFSRFKPVGRMICQLVSVSCLLVSPSLSGLTQSHAAESFQILSRPIQDRRTSDLIFLARDEDSEEDVKSGCISARFMFLSTHPSEVWDRYGVSRKKERFLLPFGRKVCANDLPDFAQDFNNVGYRDRIYWPDFNGLQITELDLAAAINVGMFIPPIGITMLLAAPVLLVVDGAIDLGQLITYAVKVIRRPLHRHENKRVREALEISYRTDIKPLKLHHAAFDRLFRAVVPLGIDTHKIP